MSTGNHGLPVSRSLAIPLCLALLALVLLGGTGCGMMINGTTQEVRFQVEPEDAKIFVNGNEINGKTIELSRKEEHRYRIEHPDLGEVSGMIEYNVDLAPILLDIFLTFYVGLLVDLPTGASNKFEKDVIVVNVEDFKKPGDSLVTYDPPTKTTPVDPGQRAGGPGQSGGTPGGAKPPGDFGAVKQPLYRDDGQRWALVVGISEYEDGSIPKIPNAAEDARAVRDFLVSPKGGGYPVDHVFLLTNYDATSRRLERYLESELRKKVQREDDLLLYFACHGMAIPSATSGNEDGLSKYLIPYDTVAEDVIVDGLSMKDIDKYIDGIECRQVAMVLDTCFSGGARSISTGPATRNTTVSSSFLKKLAKQKGSKRRIVLTACSASELAQDDPNTGHGIFTTYFLEGLGDAQDTDGNGSITLYEVFRYLDRKVRERSAEIGVRQNPQWVGDPAYPFQVRRVN